MYASDIIAADEPRGASVQQYVLIGECAKIEQEGLHDLLEVRE